MKRLIAASALLAVAVLTAVWASFSFRKELGRVSYSLTELAELAEFCSDDKLKEKTELFTRRWKRSAKILRSIFAHENIDALETDINSLPLVLKRSGRDEFLTRCVDAESKIEGLLNSEKLRMDNIF